MMAILKTFNGWSISMPGSGYVWNDPKPMVLHDKKRRVKVVRDLGETDDQFRSRYKTECARKALVKALTEDGDD